MPALFLMDSVVSGISICTHGLAAMLLAAATMQAHAQAASSPSQRGAQIAQSGGQQGVPACVSCHGAQGEGNGDIYPPLAGQPAAYLQRQLEAFASNLRKNPQMAPIAKGLTEQERVDVAAFYASLPSPVRPVQGPLPTSKDGNGAWLAERGRWEAGIPACSKCHGPGGAGVGNDFPAIAHLSEGYMNAQVKAWNAGSRDAGPLGLMGSVAKKLTAQDIADVAAYYRALQQSQ